MSTTLREAFIINNDMKKKTKKKYISQDKKVTTIFKKHYNYL